MWSTDAFSPFTVKTRECFGAGEIKTFSKVQRAREQSGVTEQKVGGRADSQLSRTHTCALTHT